MKVNQSGIRTAVKFTVFVLFLVGVGWRLYEIIRFGGKKDKSQPTPEDQDELDGNDDLAKVEATPAPVSDKYESNRIR